MQSINALTLTPDVNDWLLNSRDPRILHVFDHACNLINERREVLSIVTPEIGNGPFNLVVEDEILFSEHLYIESSIAISDNQLTLADLTIDTNNAILWPPRPNWEVLHAKRGNILTQIASLPITNNQPLLPNSLVSTLSSALANADLPSSLTAAKHLAGLGQGLTPAGDDFILGAVYAARIIHPLEMGSVFAQEISNTAVPLTTSLSAAWLKSAGKGEAGILWHEFFDALIASDGARIQEAMEKILAMGETSGADALAGFIGAFVAWMEKAGISHG
jgi:Protein of unknown function (DUF2877)